jgi:hypothetical protein
MLLGRGPRVPCPPVVQAVTPADALQALLTRVWSPTYHGEEHCVRLTHAYYIAFPASGPADRRRVTSAPTQPLVGALAVLKSRRIAGTGDTDEVGAVRPPSTFSRASGSLASMTAVAETARRAG